jgi:hypothetical protein
MIDELRDIEIRLEKLEETVSNLCCQVAGDEDKGP